MENNKDQIPYEALAFNQEISFNARGQTYPCFISRKEISISIEEDNSISLNIGDVLVKKEDTFLKLSSDKITPENISKVSRESTYEYISLWISTYWKEFEIQNKETLLSLMVDDRVSMQDPIFLSKNENLINHQDISSHSINELINLRESNIKIWNKMMTLNAMKSTSKEQHIHEIRKSFVFLEKKSLVAKVKGIRKKLDELTIIADNNNNPIKIIKDIINYEQTKLMSAKQARKKIDILQAELNQITRQIDIVNTINLDKPNRLDNDLINEILKKHREQYNNELSKIIPNIQPKYAINARKIASKLESIENEIDFRLRAFVLAQKTDRAYSQDLKNEKKSIKM